LNRETRSALFEAATVWQHAHRLPLPPLYFGGLDGQTLSSRQWVGIIEVEGARVEIYPKLDAKLLVGAPLEKSVAGSTLNDLLKMLEAATFGDWVETGRAELGESSLSYPDIWAFLLGKHLLLELRRGMVSNYLPQRDDLASVRGKISVSRQVSVLFNRMDRIACEWDEFTPDTPLNRLLKCACIALKKRVSHPAARGLLGDCTIALDDVAIVSPQTALRETERFIWTRGSERFRSTFQLARQLLHDLSPELEGGRFGSWAFLVDMNAVFEGFCRAVLEARFRCTVEEQMNVGTLFQRPNRTRQLADFVWTHNNSRWIGDAKWKLLGSKAPTFSDNEHTVKTGFVSPADVRQLTVYGLLLREKEGFKGVPQLSILYPSLAEIVQKPQTFETWTGANLNLWPVQVRAVESLEKAISIGAIDN
jgi:5-methylcytosine-specific restriction enzyme subunit McrC